jgi:ubiquinol-cytochrome c reductase cytochrome c subunit
MRFPLLVFACAVSLGAQTNLENGKKLFARHGCYQCHGYVGQGGLNGPRLAQTRLTLPAFSAYVRNPAPGGMPPFRAKVISDKDLADVYAYIKSFPEPPDVKDLPLLNQ